uniref:S-locus receptor kinase C-terminal domain-containing protein n=1 Tax=Rhizophora mucronata TaxID=61149 RepID=A0A2P2QX89_RHIMU
MLKSEIVDLPTPKQPAFMGGQTASGTESSQHICNKNSVNNVTITAIQGR